jgi:phospholipid-transporting ATPase
MFLHRGAVLRNSGYVYALVTQTGVQTKIIMNQGRYKMKFSKIEKTLNYFLIINVTLMLSMAASLALANYYFNLEHYNSYLYVF